MSEHHNKPEVLVIDDEVGIGMAISLLLEDYYRVTYVETVAAGIERLHADIALILLDLRMPGVSEYTHLVTLRARAPRVPVLILSADGSARTRSEVLQYGASGLIEKPFSRMELVSGIQAILSAQRTESASQGI